MAKITRQEVRKRGIIGKVFLVIFWAWNALMAWWLFAALSATADQSATAVTEAEKAGAAIGTALGLGMVLTFWAIGAAIFGLLVLMTRGSKTIIETTEES